jgi:dipeptidyl aminopeptidase/acylaminoacyl peptidase
MSVASQPSFSPSGNDILFLGTDTAVSYAGLGGLSLYTAELRSNRVTRVLSDGWYIAAARWSLCGERIVIVGDCDSPLSIPTMGLWVVDRDGSNPRCRTEGFIGNVGLRAHHDMPTWDTSQNSNTIVVADAQTAYATVAVRGCTEIWRIALEGKLQCDPIVTGPRSCVVLDTSSARKQLLYAVTDLFRPWDLYRMDLRSGEEQRITAVNEEVLARWPALQLSHLQFKSSDGLPLEGWFLKRSDRVGPQPTVMFIHGGPFIATGHAFRFDFHLLASNGFALVFANFRGSAGYGEPFASAIMGDWGARGFPDHMATADIAVAQELADPARMGVWGPSHGGFATAWIVGHTNRFKAAVIESATTNWLTKYYLSDATDWIVKDLGGTPEEIPDVYRSRSPLTYARRCRTPTLLLHGELDARCPIEEAEQFYRALHDAGCKTELVRIAGMTHMGDSTGPLAARKAQNEALLDWFQRHL